MKALETLNGTVLSSGKIKETSISNYKEKSSIQLFGLILTDKSLYDDFGNRLFEDQGLGMCTLQRPIFTRFCGTKVSNDAGVVNFKIVCQKRGH
jgi:hypothetical protein